MRVGMDEVSVAEVCLAVVIDAEKKKGGEWAS
jgi:hypothetical protein